MLCYSNMFKCDVIMKGGGGGGVENLSVFECEH